MYGTGSVGYEGMGVFLQQRDIDIRMKRRVE